jgi:hypothetical protein
VAVYGAPRATADVDVTVEESDVDGLIGELERAGFRLRSRKLVAEARVLALMHDPTGVPIDAVLAGPGLEEEFLARTRRADVGGIKVPVIAVEDLLAVKVLAGRPKDLDDVRGVLRGRRSVNLRQTRDVLAALDAGLGRSDLVSLFDTLAAETKRS